MPKEDERVYGVQLQPPTIKTSLLLLLGLSSSSSNIDLVAGTRSIMIRKTGSHLNHPSVSKSFLVNGPRWATTKLPKWLSARLVPFRGDRMRVRRAAQSALLRRHHTRISHHQHKNGHLEEYIVTIRAQYRPVRSESSFSTTFRSRKITNRKRSAGSGANFCPSFWAQIKIRPVRLAASRFESSSTRSSRRLYRPLLGGRTTKWNSFVNLRDLPVASQ